MQHEAYNVPTLNQRVLLLVKPDQMHSRQEHIDNETMQRSGEETIYTKSPPHSPVRVGFIALRHVAPLARGHTNDEVVICNKIKRTSIPSIITFKDCKLSLPRSWRKPSHEGLNQVVSKVHLWNRLTATMITDIRLCA